MFWKRDLEGRSVQCCTCSKWIGSRYSLLSISRFKNLGSSHSVAVLFAASLLLLEIPKLRTSCLRFQGSPVCISPLFNADYLAPAGDAALPPHPRLQTSYLPSAHLIFSSSATFSISYISDCSPIPPVPLCHLSYSGFFNRMSKIFEPKTLNYSTSSSGSYLKPGIQPLHQELV